jgi:N-acetylmuramoyl-L-alanine amidase
VTRGRTLLAVIGALVVCAAPASRLAGQSAPATPLRLLTTTGMRPIATVMQNGVEMIALDDLASTVQVTVRDDALARAITVTAGGKTIVLTPEQSIVSVAGRVISLPAPPARIAGRWYVPLEFAPRALALVTETRLDLRKNSRLLIAGDLRVPRVVVRRELPGNGARLVFDVSPSTPHAVVQEPGRLVVRFEGADAIDATLPPIPSEGWVQGLRAVNTPPSIVIELGPRFGSFRATDAPGDASSDRLIVDIVSASEPEAPPTTTTTPETSPLAPSTPAGLRTIVLDAGHGGADTGTKGARGTLEKDVTLAVARRLKTALEARLGAHILLTRDADADVPLDARASLANNNKADLFVSIHGNGSVRPSAAGAEVYYAGIEHGENGAQPSPESGAAMLPLFGGGTREIDIVPWERAQARHVDQSGVLARLVESALRGAVPMNPRALQQAPLRVLIGANTPAVLVEIGYLTNREQEDQLRAGELQGRVVQALADAIQRFDARVRGPAILPTAEGGAR